MANKNSFVKNIKEVTFCAEICIVYTYDMIKKVIYQNIRQDINWCSVALDVKAIIMSDYVEEYG